MIYDSISDSTILALSDDIADKCIMLRKANKFKLPDAIIAATALVNNLTLITRNIDDFKNINELQIINHYAV